MQYLPKSSKVWPLKQNQFNHTFEELKTYIAHLTTLEHYYPKAETVLTTDASTLGLGITLWQVDEHGRRAVAFASRYLAEKRYQRVRTLGSNSVGSGHLRRKLKVETYQKA